MWQIKLPHPTLQIDLYCISDGTIGIGPRGQFKAVLEAVNGSDWVYDMSGISYTKDEESEHFNYNERIAYKEFPVLLEWLQAQGFEYPEFSI